VRRPHLHETSATTAEMAARRHVASGSGPDYGPWTIRRPVSTRRAGTIGHGISWAAPREKASSLAQWLEGNQEVMGPTLECLLAPGGRVLPTTTFSASWAAAPAT
jgi:hypothetical protein